MKKPQAEILLKQGLLISKKRMGALKRVFDIEKIVLRSKDRRVFLLKLREPYLHYNGGNTECFNKVQGSDRLYLLTVYKSEERNIVPLFESIAMHSSVQSPTMATIFDGDKKITFLSHEHHCLSTRGKKT